MMRRALWLIPMLLLIAVLADTAVWYVAEQRLGDGLTAWVADRRAEGWTVTAVAPAPGGWPTAATLTLRDFELSGGKLDIPNGLSWRADRVVLRLTPRDLHKLHIEAAGLQHLRVSDAPGIAYSATHLEAVVPLQPEPLAQVLDLHGEGVRAHVSIGGQPDSMTIESLAVQIVLHPAAGRGQAAVSLAGAADNIALPERADWALGSHVRSVTLEGAVDGPLPDAPSLPQRATQWRDSGGQVELQDVALRWGALDLTARATLRLDDQLQLAGSATAQVSGYAPTLDVLATHGVISNSAAIAAKAMLSLIAATPVKGGPAEVEVPLTLKQGVLSMHQVPLLRLPHLDWPAS
ncbi:MAG TPA: DUF2125 domain-containing protein [Acetobacteraceae bacterium]|jgi:hypothetical protein|nr:DUF2125 domain-containing protein [Acetobacteraceae bacterium]